LRRVIGVLCILAIVAGALLAPVSGGSTPGILVPLAPQFGLVVLPAPEAADTAPTYSLLPSAPLPSRAPPAVA
jgi:hypothetical protein